MLFKEKSNPRPPKFIEKDMAGGYGKIWTKKDLVKKQGPGVGEQTRCFGSVAAIRPLGRTAIRPQTRKTI